MTLSETFQVLGWGTAGTTDRLDAGSSAWGWRSVCGWTGAAPAQQHVGLQGGPWLFYSQD